VIGASAGGIDALGKIMPALTAGFSLPIIVVLHLAPQKPSLLAEIFKPKTSIAVKEADEKEKIVGGVVYCAPPGYHLLVEKDFTFSLSIEAPVCFSRPAIDVLFESAADAYGSRLAGIILTGANNDGSMGLKAIKRAGGVTLVQDPAEAALRTMPESAIAEAGPDFILPLKDIVKKIIEFDRRTTP